ncbi:hypothetical protein IC575_002529 [Cucumis melo]
MTTPKSNRGKEKMEDTGFSGVNGSCDYLVQSPDHQPLQLVPYHVGCSSHSVGCSSSGINLDRRRVGRKSSSKPKASKKKNGYHQPQGEKKQRLIWTPELHQCFVDIFNRTPSTKLFPRTILEQMSGKYPFVTRENIASHLQKHKKNLNKKDEEENSAKASSKSVPLKIPKESNSQSINPKTSNSNSTFPNSQLILQSYPNSTNPISSQVLLHSHPNSAIPSFDDKTWVQNSQGCGFSREQFEQFALEQIALEQLYGCLKRSINHQVDYQQQQHSFNNNVCESQENPNWALQIGQSSTAPISDLAVSTNLCPPPISANQISGNDGNGIGFHPIMDFNSFGGWNNTNNDPFLDTDLPNFAFGNCYDNPEPLDFRYPLNLNTINGFQTDSEQMYYPSINPMENDFTFQQCFDGYNHPNVVPQTFDNDLQIFNGLNNDQISQGNECFPGPKGSVT